MMEFLSDVLGVPVQTSYVPAVTNVDFPDKMTYFQRFTNTLLEAANNYGFRAVHDIETEIFRKYFGYAKLKLLVLYFTSFLPR